MKGVGKHHPKDESTPLVSVCISTYNHESYITQALDSALAQETDFDFEIVVGEDDSSDKTRDICIDYAKKYPDKIRLYLNDRKNVIYIDGIATGRWNLTNIINQSRGKYIALLEGDDYWTDTNKLQIQADILDKEPGYSMCFHDALFFYQETQEYKDFSSHLIKSYGENPLEGNQLIEFGIKDVLEKWMIPTASIMYRRQLLESFPKWFYEIFSGDRGLHLLLADMGSLIFVNKKMSVQRRHSKGLSRYIDGVWLQKNKLNVLHKFNKYKNYKYDDLIAPQLAFGFEKISYGGKENAANMKVDKSISHLFISMGYFKRLGYLTNKRRLVMLVKWVMNRPNIRTYKDLFKFKNNY